MITWLSANLATIVVSVILIAVTAAVIRTLIRDRKQGKHSCGGNCAACGMCRSAEHSNK